MSKTQECTHGRLARQCETCEAIRERDEARAEVEAMRKDRDAADFQAGVFRNEAYSLASKLTKAEADAAALRMAFSTKATEEYRQRCISHNGPAQNEIEEEWAGARVATSAGTALLERLRVAEAIVLMEREKLAAAGDHYDALRAEVERLKPNQREHDLVRHQRMELFTEHLITEAEYAALASERGGVQRLEDYDRLRARVAELEAGLEEATQKMDTMTYAVADIVRLRALLAQAKEESNG